MTTSNTLRRIAGRPVQVERESDGVQRTEILSDGHGVTYGRVFKARWMGYVLATRPDGQFWNFRVGKWEMTTEQAFTAARKWLVGEAA